MPFSKVIERPPAAPPAHTYTTERVTPPGKDGSWGVFERYKDGRPIGIVRFRSLSKLFELG